jgi:ABC-type polysaccharide/polyol phosphate export permease
MISTVRNLWSRRDLAWELIRADMRSSSADSRLGWMWWILDPLLMMGVYWVFKVLVFGRGKYAPYPIFVGVALLAWRHLSTTASRSVKTLRTNEALIKSVPFPTAILPLSQAVAQFLYFAISMVVLTIVAIAIGCPATLMLIQLPALALLQLCLVAGVSLAVSSVGVLVRDLEVALGHALRIGWYLSPGIYGLDLLTTRFGGGETRYGDLIVQLYMTNPFAVLIVGYRSAVFDPRWLPPLHWAVLGAEAAAILLAGYWIFRHFDRRIVKFV